MFLCVFKYACNVMSCDAMDCSPMQCNAMRCDVTQCNVTIESRGYPPQENHIIRELSNPAIAVCHFVYHTHAISGHFPMNCIVLELSYQYQSLTKFTDGPSIARTCYLEFIHADMFRRFHSRRIIHKAFQRPVYELLLVICP